MIHIWEHHPHNHVLSFFFAVQVTLLFTLTVGQRMEKAMATHPQFPIWRTQDVICGQSAVRTESDTTGHDQQQQAERRSRSQLDGAKPGLGWQGPLQRLEQLYICLILSMVLQRLVLTGDSQVYTPWCFHEVVDGTRGMHCLSQLQIRLFI